MVPADGCDCRYVYRFVPELDLDERLILAYEDEPKHLFMQFPRLATGRNVLFASGKVELFAEEAGLSKRWIVPVPVLTPRLSSYWIHLVTPVPAVLARPLAEGLSNRVVCNEERIRELLPQDLLSCRQAIRLALERVNQEAVESSIDAGSVDLDCFNQTYFDRLAAFVAAAAARDI